MIGYNPQYLANYFHRANINKWLKSNIISQEAYNQLLSELQPYYKSSNIFIYIALFVVTAIIISSAIGFIALLFSDFVFDDIPEAFSLLIATSLLIILQKVVINHKKQFRTGIDDATLYTSIVFIYVAAFLIFEDSLFNSGILISIFSLIIFGIFAIIYVDRLLSILSILSLYAFLFFSLNKMDLPILLPFIGMGLSLGIYFSSTKLMGHSGNEAAMGCWDIIRWLTVVLFYCSGNIVIIKEMSEALGLADAFPTFLLWVFYGYTLFVPVYFIYKGIKIKQIQFVTIGLICIAAGILSIRYYHSFLPASWALVIGGSVLIIIVKFALNIFKKSKNVSISEANTSAGITIESLILDQTFGKMAPGESGDFKGKGGEFGGGGATGHF